VLFLHALDGFLGNCPARYFGKTLQLGQYHGRVAAMRSDLVFDALQTKNRFALCHEAFKAVRLLHKSNTRVEETTNRALQRLAGMEKHEFATTTDEGVSLEEVPEVE